jgi:hypothetical protein
MLAGRDRLQQIDQRTSNTDELGSHVGEESVDHHGPDTEENTGVVLEEVVREGALLPVAESDAEEEGGESVGGR